jgi:L-ascorbate metabolism protein UlaG (beta-lactamase superfamily)
MPGWRKRYKNLDDVQTVKSFAELIRWRKERSRKTKDLTFTVPAAERVDLAYLGNNRQETAIIWIGHATFLLQIGGLNMVTDPVWAKRMGFERRLSDPGIPLEQMPLVDLVLISHGHYDHLDFPTLRKLPGSPRYFVPSGLASLFKRKGFRDVQEFDWWERKRIRGIDLTFVPAQHWVSRTLWDTNTSHWGGWIIEKENGACIYFAGDSGYCRAFKEIGERFKVDCALMPIGAYEPEWFMSAQHMTPEEAVQAFLDLRAKMFIPMHYGAFRLADDTPQEALERLLAEWERLALPAEQLKILKLGEILPVAEGEQP